MQSTVGHQQGETNSRGEAEVKAEIPITELRTLRFSIRRSREHGSVKSRTMHWGVSAGYTSAKYERLAARQKPRYHSRHANRPHPQAFVAKWRPIELHERAMAQEHFIDLCRLLDHPTPAKAGATGGSPWKKRTLTNLYNARPTWLDERASQARRRGLRRLRLAHEFARRRNPGSSAGA